MARRQARLRAGPERGGQDRPCDIYPTAMWLGFEDQGAAPPSALQARLGFGVVGRSCYTPPGSSVSNQILFRDTFDDTSAVS